MNLQSIALSKLNSIVIELQDGTLPAENSLSLIAEFIALGYMPSNLLVDVLALASEEALTTLYKDVLPAMRKAVGAHVNHRPLFPNFPTEIGTYDQVSKIRPALQLYNKTGEWDPNVELPNRKIDWEEVKYRKVNVANFNQFNEIFTNILRSADSVTENDRKIIKWFMEAGRPILLPDVIPFKENVCVVAAELLKQGKWKKDLVKTPNDVLRIATYLSEGDISLAENTKFKNLPRKYRKVLVQALESVSKDEDFVQHKNKWIKLGHSLHVGDYSKPLWNTFKKLRENQKIETFNGKLEHAIETKNWFSVIAMLKGRPGVFARKIGQLLTLDSPRDDVVAEFNDVVDKVPTRNLTQLWGSLKTRYEDVNKRVVFPKGSVAKAYVLRNELAKIDPKHLDRLIEMVKVSLKTRFATGEDLGKVWIDPDLINCPLPTGMRSASEALREVARGTRMDIGNKSTLRFFIYWKGQDIDLSASFHDENFEKISEVAYYNLEDDDACHSGDITNAPNGASEFIDINIKSAIAKQKARYVVMTVYVFSGPNFSEHEECFAGWMTRDNVGSNAVYTPKSVENKIDLRSESKNVIPVIFDLKERKAINCDLTSSRRGSFNTMPNNVENNRASIQETVESIVSLDNKISLFDLFELHAKARGELVTDKAEADTIFSMNNEIEDKDIITPFDITRINSEFVI